MESTISWPSGFCAAMVPSVSRARNLVATPRLSRAVTLYTMWVKLDAKFPIDWEHDEDMPITTELQLGKNINDTIAVYVDALVGIGGDRPYDWGVGTGLRFKY